jgi:uncharacterized protein with beta-barrel porin domain
MNARFAAAQNSTTFVVNGADLGRDWCWLGTGLTWQALHNISLFGNYDVLVNSCQTLHTGSGGLSYAW